MFYCLCGDWFSIELFLCNSSCTGEGQGDHTATVQLLLLRQQPVHQPQGQCGVCLRRRLRLQLRIRAGGAAHPEEAPLGGQLRARPPQALPGFSQFGEGRDTAVIFNLPPPPPLPVLLPPQCAPTRDSTTSSFMSTEPSLTLGQTKGGIPAWVGGLVFERQHITHVFLSKVLPPSSAVSVCISSWHPRLASNKHPKHKMRQLCDVRTQCFSCTLVCKPFSRIPPGQTRRTDPSTAENVFFVILLTMLKNLCSTYIHPTNPTLPKEWLTFLNICTFPQKNVNLHQSS